MNRSSYANVVALHAGNRYTAHSMQHGALKTRFTEETQTKEKHKTESEVLIAQMLTNQSAQA